MIKISTRGRYGARVMVELAANYGRPPLVLKDIARLQRVSEGYLEHIIAALKAARLIRSGGRGKGGYALGRPPERITLGDVVRAVEGNIAIVDCVESPRICPQTRTCVTRDVWCRISRTVSGILNKITLAQMVERRRRKQGLRRRESTKSTKNRREKP